MLSSSLMLPSCLRSTKVGLKVRLSTVALVSTALASCGGDLPGRYYPRSGAGQDGGACWSHGGPVACDCKAELVALAVELGFFGRGVLGDVDVDFVRSTSTTPSATLPPQESAGASGYVVASLKDASGATLATVALADPRTKVSDGGSAWTRFLLPVPSAPAELHVENWGTGQILVDLDLRGHVQLLCIDRPCLSICSGAVDGGALAPWDAASVDSVMPDKAVVPLDAGAVQ